jgi:HK97 family phage portal protein
MLDEVADLRKEIRTYSQDVLTGRMFSPVNNEISGVNRDTALRVATWFTCLQVRWDSVAMLPFNIYKMDGKRKEIASNDNRQYLLHTRPNPKMTATQFWRSVQQKRDNNGNAYAFMTRDSRGVVVRIDLAPDSDQVQVYASDELYYRWCGKEYSSADVLHFKGLSLDGQMGLSLTQYHASTIGRLRSLHRYSTRSVASNPGIYATTANQQPMSDKGKISFKEYWEKEMSGFGDTGEIPVLYNGYELKTVGINPKDVLYLEQIKASKEDIYGITKVPPKLAQNYDSGNTYNNAEQQGLDFLTWTMIILLKDIEDECNYKLFTEEERASYFTKFNEKALLRTDAATQAAYLEKIFNIGGYSVNEILEILDENPLDIESANDHFIQGNNLVPLRLLDQVILSRASKGSPSTTSA